MSLSVRTRCITSVVEKIGNTGIQRVSQSLNIVQCDAVLGVFNVANLILGQFGGVRQILLTQRRQ
jgi:hypothetical protein